MPAVPQILKVITLTIDGEDFAPDCIDAALVPSPGPVQSVITLDGEVHQDAQSETWALVLTIVIDWDQARPGLAHYLFENRGTVQPFTFKKDEGAHSTSNPLMMGNVTIVPAPYGGNGNEFAEATVTLPVDGIPTQDVTP